MLLTSWTVPTLGMASNLNTLLGDRKSVATDSFWIRQYREVSLIGPIASSARLQGNRSLRRVPAI